MTTRKENKLDFLRCHVGLADLGFQVEFGCKSTLLHQLLCLLYPLIAVDTPGEKLHDFLN